MKKYLGIFVVMLALTASAFTTNHKNVKPVGANSYTYKLYGKAGQDIQANMDNPANYTFVGTGALSCPGIPLHRCGVENATDDGTGKPDFTQSYSPKDRN
jgi:hypothetical protein